MPKISILSILLFIAAEVRSQDSVTFQTQGLSSKTSCSQLTRNDCMFYHEAIDKCASVCDSKIKNNDDKNDQKPSKDKGKSKQKGKGCFHGDETVRTEKWGNVPLSQLAGKTDVRVLTRGSDGQARFSRIYYWIHAYKSLNYDFLEFHTDSDQTISLTKDHLIYTGECGSGKPKKALFAQRLQPGACVFVYDGQNFTESRIVARRLTKKRGVYNPITEQGNLVVNGVLASCYACLENEPLQSIMYVYMHWVHRVLSILVPSNLMAMFYSSPFSSQVAVPEVVFSFWDLAKKFVR